MALLFVNDRDLLLTGLQADYLCSIHSVLNILFSLSPKHTFREHQIIVHIKSGINLTVIPSLLNKLLSFMNLNGNQPSTCLLVSDNVF